MVIFWKCVISFNIWYYFINWIYDFYFDQMTPGVYKMAKQE